MARKKNSGLGSFAFKPPKAQQPLDVAKVPTSFGQYPSVMQVGSTRYPTVLEAWNRDSVWKRWWQGYEIARMSHYGWPLRKFPFKYAFDLGQISKQVHAICHIYPSLSGDNHAWWTLMREDDSINLADSFEPIPLRVNDLGLQINPRTGIGGRTFEFIYRIRSSTRLSVDDLIKFLDSLSSRRVLNRHALNADGSIGAAQETFASMELVDARVSGNLRPARLISLVFTAGVLIKNGTPVGGFDPTNAADVAAVTGTPRALTLGRSFACSCPDFLKRQTYDLTDSLASDVAKAPVATTESGALPEKTGYYRSWEDRQITSDDPKKWCKHIYALCELEGHYVPDPNDYPQLEAMEAFRMEAEKRKTKLQHKMLEQMSKFKGLSADSAADSISQIFALKRENVLPSGFGHAAAWFQTEQQPKRPTQGDIWQKPGSAHTYYYNNGAWEELSLLG